MLIIKLMKIFIINLKKAIGKRQRMIKILSDMGHDCEIFDAINGSDVDSRQYESSPHWVDPYHHTHITEGEVGCALSHFSIWQKISDSDIERAIILEDDIDIVDEGFVGKCESVKLDYDLIYLGRKKIGVSDEERVPNENGLVANAFSYWTCAYMVSKSGARKLACQPELFIRNIIPIDEYIPYMCGKQHFDNESSIRIENTFGTMSRNVVSYAFEPPLIKPTNCAFNDSSTYHSRPYNCMTDITCLSIATDKNDCYARYVASCEKYGINPCVMGLGRKWCGGNMAKGPGGGHKINLLREFISTADDDGLFLFTDNYDVIMNDHINILLTKYKKYYNGKIVFAGETACWPDQSLSERYPDVAGGIATKYLNSGLFIGSVRDIKKLIETPIRNDADDQLYYTNKFLENQSKIVIDYDCRLFLCLNGITNDIHIDKSKSCVLYKGERPAFIHGNGPESVKIFLNNNVTNYCIEYNSTYGHRVPSNVLDRRILHVIYETCRVDNRSFVDRLVSQRYPKNMIDILVIYNSDEFSNSFEHLVLNSEYNTIVRMRENTDVWSQVVDWIRGSDCDYLYYQETRANITNPDCLTRLVSENRKAIAPLLCEVGSPYANYWGDIDATGFYKRSNNYFDITERREIGCWNVPYITHTMLLSKEFVNEHFLSKHDQGYTDVDMLLCSNIRNSFNFMYILNTEVWGSLDVDINLSTICSDRDAWEKKYLNMESQQNNWNHENLGNNIHKLYMFNEAFCRDIIALAENKQEWSRGGERYYDKRIGNYENHPTQDVQLHQLGVNDMWKKIVDVYISPFVSDEYKYQTKDINLSFVVKYSMNGQKELNPHHDSSTYTVNICLNQDFEGGGCHFIKQNQTVINKDLGSLIIHPGRLTHYHKGQSITDGTRYILVSFIN